MGACRFLHWLPPDDGTGKYSFTKKHWCLALRPDVLDDDFISGRRGRRGRGGKCRGVGRSKRSVSGQLLCSCKNTTSAAHACHAWVDMKALARGRRRRGISNTPAAQPAATVANRCSAELLPTLAPRASQPCLPLPFLSHRKLPASGADSGWTSKHYVICVCFHCHGTSSYHTTNTKPYKFPMHCSKCVSFWGGGDFVL